MKTVFSVTTYFILFLVLFLIACEEKKELPDLSFINEDITEANLIPLPLEIEANQGAFALSENTVLSFNENSSDYEKVSKYFLEKISKNLDLDINDNGNDSEYPKNTIHFTNLIDQNNTNPEAYFLNIKSDSIVIASNTAEGAFRGIQTLRQLLPEKSLDTIAEYKIWPVPQGKIKDEPTFNYRGTMVDVARHFFTVDEIKKHIDILAYYKINVLHLHLSDDQGWRIEIKSWPKLTEIGGKSEVGGGEGGFYTQEDYQGIVKYAADRFITVIPEIDMPGHTNAASVAYPFLNGNGKIVKPYTGMKVGFSTFDTRKDSVYTFIDDVIREISAMTPGPYFHIGGDESHVTKKDDYIHFVNKVEKIVQKHGKIMIGWDEVVTADIDGNSVAQYWSSEKNAKIAADKNLKMIISPGKKAYLDMKYNKDSEYGLTWAGMIPVDSAYIWSPTTYTKGFPKENILGIEAPLWSETISNLTELQYLAFPRLIGYAELGWTPDHLRNWEDYKRRLQGQQRFLEQNDVNFYRTQLVNWEE